ncbi:leucine-rich repeat-containing protein 18 [Sarcoptes scabiei]|uniref:Leucine-rich repeat-containing protein 18 n=1 Tax=Sarcoptes scabiei TaxID=52283 RepID=A0A132A8Z8_SARSC|nr:leucine-rich repeat-containing protein 18 [Sarcoptes scabiei]
MNRIAKVSLFLLWMLLRSHQAIAIAIIDHRSDFHPNPNQNENDGQTSWVIENFTTDRIETIQPSTRAAKFSSRMPQRCPSPPCICDVDDQQRKSVTCIDSLRTIPLAKMDPETQVITITSKPGRYNSLNLGPIFTNLTFLEEIHITRSKLPAIGESTFCSPNCIPSCRSSIRILDLSQNNIANLVQGNFNCLDYLEILDLSENDLSDNLPSAPFMRLRNLRRLFLRRNKLDKLVPLMFHSLSTLEELDLSQNQLAMISMTELRGLKNLQKLILRGNQLTRLDSFLFNEMEQIIHLDLSHNRIKHLKPQTFSGLVNLRTLWLQDNSLTVLPDMIFQKLQLEELDLSNNLINPLTNCVFCDADRIRKLDLSHNKLTSFSSILLEPIAYYLEQLWIDNNVHLIDPPSSLVALLQPLKRLKKFSASAINLSKLPDSTFDLFDSITFLNISNNNLTELNNRLLEPLQSLKILDVSNNELSFIDPGTFQALRTKYLYEIYLQNNPFSCYHCRILPFLDWLNGDPMEYWKVCAKLTDDPERLKFCAKCSTPYSLKDRYLHEPGLSHELEWCTNPEIQLRLTASEPQVGLILAFLIIIMLVAVIVVVVAVYRKHGAVYYTQEDKITSKEEIYAASVAAHPLNWSSTNQPNRFVSLSSTNNTLSRQNTILSPQTSIDQSSSTIVVDDHKNVVHLEQQSSAQISAVDPKNIIAVTVTGVETMNKPKTTITSSAASKVCPTSNVNCVGCVECANTTAVKQVIASIPAMSEMLENSLRKISDNQASIEKNLENFSDKSVKKSKNFLMNGTIIKLQPIAPPMPPIKKHSLASTTTSKSVEQSKPDQNRSNGIKNDNQNSDRDRPEKSSSTTTTTTSTKTAQSPLENGEKFSSVEIDKPEDRTKIDDPNVHIYI